MSTFEDPTAPVSEVYDRLAPDYDRRWASYVRASVEESLRRLEWDPGERIGDVGCGTGELLHRLLEREPSVRGIGLDLSIEMLAVARKKIGATAALVTADAARLPLATGSLDLAVSTNSLRFWREPRRSLGEIARVLGPGGRVLVTDWCDDYWACRICDRFLRIFDRAHHRTFGVAGLVGRLRDAGFVKVKVERYRIGWLWGLMTAVAETPSASRRRSAAAAVVEEARTRARDRGGPLVIAVDGRSGSGKSTLARRLAEALGAAVVPCDDFFAAHIGDEGWEGRTPEERARDALDWRRLRREALAPLLDARPARWRAFDFRAGPRPDGTFPMREEEKTRAPARFVVLDGAYSARPELADLVDLAVLVEAPEGVRRERLSARESRDRLDAWHARWDAAEDHYFTEVRPRDSFDLVVTTAEVASNER